MHYLIHYDLSQKLLITYENNEQIIFTSGVINKWHQENITNTIPPASTYFGQSQSQSEYKLKVE